MSWESRIVSFDPAVDADSLLANPRNPRLHPSGQAQAMRGSLDELGWIDAVKVNTVTDTVIDGHLRVAEAISAGTTVPVLYVALDEDEERKALAVFDQITNMAVIDRDVYADLVAGLDWGSEALAALAVNVLSDGPSVSGEGEPPEPADHPLAWGFVAWDKARRIESTESEVTALDAAYTLYVDRNGDDIGFVRWLIDGER